MTSEQTFKQDKVAVESLSWVFKLGPDCSDVWWDNELQKRTKQTCIPFQILSTMDLFLRLFFKDHMSFDGKARRKFGGQFTKLPALLLCYGESF